MQQGYNYDPRAIQQRLNAVMKSTNPQLSYNEEDTERVRLMKELEDFKVELQQAVDFMKKVLLTEIFGHLKVKHGIYEKSCAEWYYEDTEEWAKQYCIFTWDEERKAIPKYWCDSGCEECDKLYKKYQSTMDIADTTRINAINGIKNVKEDLKRLDFEQKQRQQNQNTINKQPAFINNQQKKK